MKSNLLVQFLFLSSLRHSEGFVFIMNHMVCLITRHRYLYIVKNMQVHLWSRKNTEVRF